MKDELAIHEDLCTALEMFNMATKGATTEGRLSLLELPDADPEDKKSKAKDVKRKGPIVLAAGGRSRVPWKLAMKRLRISSQEEIEPGGRFRSHEQAPSLSAMGNQFAMTFSSLLAALMLSS